MNKFQENGRNSGRKTCFRSLAIVIVYASILYFNKALATPPPEQVPAICAQTICLLVLPEASIRVTRYASEFNMHSQEQILSAKLSTGVVVHVVSRPTRKGMKKGQINSDVNWSKRSEKLFVASSCLLCSGEYHWGGQAIGIAIYGDESRSVNSFLEGGGIRLWSLNMNGKWMGNRRDLPLSHTYRIPFPSQDIRESK